MYHYYIVSIPPILLAGIWHPHGPISMTEFQTKQTPLPFGRCRPEEISSMPLFPDGTYPSTYTSSMLLLVGDGIGTSIFFLLGHWPSRYTCLKIEILKGNF